MALESSTSTARATGKPVSPATATGVGEKVHEPMKLAAIVDTLVADGIPAREALRNVPVSLQQLHDPATRISLSQLLTACQNAMRLSQDPSLPYRIGSTIHVSTYGMYGYAILCSTDFRRAMEFAATYHSLAAPLATIAFSEQGGAGVWTIQPISAPMIDERLHRFIVEFQTGIHISLHRDVMGASFVPREIALAYPQADGFRITPEQVGCPVRFDQPDNRMVFDAKWLDATPKLGNRTTYAAILAMCDDFLTDLSCRTGAAGKIRELLVQNIAGRPTLTEIAALLGTTSRTLRRQLTSQGTSFRALVDELRAQAAMKYLRETVMTTEDIAFALGFTDPANFRHAFRRWTGSTPSDYRRDRR